MLLLMYFPLIVWMGMIDVMSREMRVAPIRSRRPNQE